MESRVARATLGEVAVWGPTNYQLASLMDMLGSRWAGRKWKAIPRPKAKGIERPGMPVEEKRRRLDRLRQRQRKVRGD